MNHALDQYDKDEKELIIQSLENRQERPVDEVLAEVSRQTLPKYRAILNANGFNLSTPSRNDTAEG